ncbi:unannotated protein [freshwater metagenome]|uniref:Unannotated protein n=1 Tax=freshwater metagenome TaxID=449393 RepID=A0A6J6YGS6_9ZZZZ
MRCCRVSFGLGVAHDDMHAVSEPQRATVTRSTGAHIAHKIGDAIERVGPHEIHIGSSSSYLASIVRKPAKIQRWTTSAHRADTRRIEM